MASCTLPANPSGQPSMAQSNARSHRHLHGHGHGHGHAHDHVHAVTQGNERRIGFVLVLTFGYAIIQAVGGWLSGSLALIADSGHMVSDAAALLLALVA